MYNTRSVKLLCGVIVLGIMPLIAVAAYIAPNNVKVQAKADVSYDAASGLYTYSYSFANDPTSVLEVSDIIIPLNRSAVINVTVPQGWSMGASLDGVITTGGTISFSATGSDDNTPLIWDGVTPPPSTYQIKQGQTLSGFSFQSPDPPAVIDFHAQGYTKIPELGVDVPDYDVLGISPPSDVDPSESFKGQTKGPNYTETLYTGNRRPATDGFLVFKNLVSRDTKVAPVQVDIEFGINGETVDQNTFRATLNSKDITAQFKPTGPKTMRAVFQPTQLNIGGRNTLLTTVQGILPSNGRTVGDVDRITFTVQP